MRHTAASPIPYLGRCWELGLELSGFPQEEHMRYGLQNVGEVCPPAFPLFLAETSAEESCCKGSGAQPPWGPEAHPWIVYGTLQCTELPHPAPEHLER